MTVTMPDCLNKTETETIALLRGAGFADSTVIQLLPAFVVGGYDDRAFLGDTGGSSPATWEYAATIGVPGTMSVQQPAPGEVFTPSAPDHLPSFDVWGATDTLLPDPGGVEVTIADWEASLYFPPITLPATPSAFTTAWAAGLHVGDASPRMVVEIRRGRWDRDWVTISSDDALAATIYGEESTAPWMALWDPAEDWLEVPGIAEYNEQHAFAENGCQIVTLTMENVRYTEQTGIDDLPYREIERGFASPTRGYEPDGRSDDGLDTNEWYDRLARMAQIRVWQGYGDPVRGSAVNGSTMPTDGGTNGMWVFAGQIDDIDLSDAPDHITITCRNGQPLTDQEFFGWSKSSQLAEPIVFADRTDAADNPFAGRWILVDDVADVIRVILRWAGYTDTAVENTGVRMKGHKGYNRENKLVEAINDITEQTGYSFWFTRPLDGESLALPVFRYTGARTPAPAGMTEVTESNLVTALDYKQSMAPLAYIIRVRGKGDGLLGGEMAVYRPPWSHQPGDPALLEDRLGGLLKHVTLTRPALRTAAECGTFARLLALNEALEAVQAIVEIPGHPGLGLDEQVGVTDSTAAVNSRLWVSERSNTFTTGPDTSWRTTLIGPFLDFPDVAAMLTEVALA